MKIAIIGAGPSGIAAALQAAWQGASVTLYEKNEAIGRKLLVTGSGRCNITNDGVSAARYACAEIAWIGTLLKSFGVSDLLAMLHEIGIPVVKTSDGWYYPLSNSAQTVVDGFAGALHQAAVSLNLSHRVVKITAGQKNFKITSVSDSEEKEELFEKIILAAGGKAYPTLGSTGELFPVLEQLGHTVLPKRPALAPVLVDLQDLKTLQGVRLDVGVGLWNGNKRIAGSAGNLIFTRWGLNGPAVMDISHHISANPAARFTLSLDLLHFFNAEFNDLLDRKRNSSMPMMMFLEAFFVPKVAQFYLRNAKISPEKCLTQVDAGTLQKLIDRLKDTRRDVKGVRGFEYCQVSAGGVPVTEVNPETLESKRVKGLFLIGETLDVVGPCGGYNLQYAFSSGALAGRAAARP